jgi:polyadenylate-binding protein
MKNKDLEEHFSKHGDIKSLKISLNQDHTSRGYGFVCFKDEGAASKALEASSNADSVQAVKFEPKDRREIRKLINNIYVKNIPLEWTDKQVKDMFAPFGEIKSLVLNKNDMGQFGFVCYDDPKGVSKEYGPECAKKAIEGLQGRVMGKGPDGKEIKLYVRAAMKKNERVVEKIKETIKYKNSKKRCNLYVKNFPSDWTEDNLRDLFKQCGEIEKIRLDKGKAGNAYAFICYKQPDAAANAKSTLSNQTYGDKVLIINHYEIKELRKIELEAAKDKADFQNYKTKQTGGLKWNDLNSHPHLTQIIQQILALIQQNEAMNEHMNNAGRQQMNMQRGGNRQMRYNNNRQQYNQNQGMFNQMQGQPVPRNNMPQVPQQQMPMPQQQRAPMQGMPQMPGVPQQQPGMPAAPMMNQQAMSVAQKYQVAASKYLPAVDERNVHMKDQVGNTIYDYVLQLCGPDKAPKITGMLIELPVEQIKQYMGSYEALQMKVSEANELLMKQEM